MRNKTINKLPETTVTAAEFIALLDAAVFEPDDAKRVVAVQRFRERMAEIKRNQEAAKGKHSQN